MSEQEEDQKIKEVSGWSLSRDGVHEIKKDFKFKNFKKAMGFVNEVAELAEEEGHHPDFCIHYNRVNLALHTHAIKGLHENDFHYGRKNR